jgi:hypothetical protein
MPKPATGRSAAADLWQNAAEGLRGGGWLLRRWFQLGALLIAAGAASADTLYVDARKGSWRGEGSKRRPLPTISAALERAAAGDEIVVAPGRYREHVALKAGVALLGSGSGTIIDAMDFPLGAVTCADEARIQGFRIVDPGPAQALLATIDCSNGTSPEIAHNLIEAPNRPAILLAGSDAWIHHNTIRGGVPSPQTLFGLVVGSGRPVIEDNEIASNGVAIGLECAPGDPGARIQRNVLRGRVGVSPPVGSHAVPVTITDNVFLPSVALHPVQSGLFLLAQSFFPFGTLAAHVANNTFHATFGITIGGGEAVIANNVLVNGVVGIQVNAMGLTPELRGNDVFDNSTPILPDTNYVGIADPTGSDGNLSVDPQLADVAGGDFRPRPASPVLDAGSDADVVSPRDLDGDPRVVDGDGEGGAAVDIGAHELQPWEAPPLPALAIRVDLLPKRDPNELSLDLILRGKGRVYVAILSDAELDAPAEIDKRTLTLGHASLRRCKRKDVDGDGFRDLACKVPIAGIPVSGPVCVRGVTRSDRPVLGCDTIHITP